MAVTGSIGSTLTAALSNAFGHCRNKFAQVKRFSDKTKDKAIVQLAEIPDCCGCEDDDGAPALPRRRSAQMLGDAAGQLAVVTPVSAPSAIPPSLYQTSPPTDYAVESVRVIRSERAGAVS